MGEGVSAANGGWNGRRVVVTGGTGFIGGALVQRLVELGAHVLVPTRDKSRIGSGGERIDYVRADIGNPRDAHALVSGADILFNLAYDFRRTADENIMLYTVLADACAAQGVARLVQTSSIAVYDDWPLKDVDENSPCDMPRHAYKAAKRAIEKDIAARVSAGQFDAVILQPTIVYGPASPQWTDILVERMHGGAVILPREGLGLCNGLYIDDLVDAFIAAGEMEQGGAERFIVSGPEPFEWSTLFAAYAEACGAQVVYEDMPPYVPPSANNASPPPGGLSALVQRLSASLAAHIGTARLERLRKRVMKLKPGSAPYSPSMQDPRLYHGRGVASIAKASAQLCAPKIGPQEGLARTADYIRQVYPPKP